MMAMRCFVWPPALQLWSGRLADEKLNFGDFLKFYNYLTTCKCFLVFNAVFDVRWTNIIP